MTEAAMQEMLLIYILIEPTILHCGLSAQKKIVRSVIRHHSTELQANRQLLKTAICHFRP
jgi:hypothetical protein